MTDQQDDDAAQVAWDAAKPRSRKRDRHGREELLVHPFPPARRRPTPPRREGATRAQDQFLSLVAGGYG